MNISVVNTSPYPLPKYQTEHSAGMDLYANIDEPVTLKSRERSLVPTGISIALPDGYEAQIRARSGLAARHAVVPTNGVGTIDADYRGEIHVVLINHGNENFVIEPGMRIAQMVIAKYEHAEWQEIENLEDTVRGKGGFGSTGH